MDSDTKMIKVFYYKDLNILGKIILFPVVIVFVLVFLMMSVLMKKEEKPWKIDWEKAKNIKISYEETSHD